MQDGNSDADAGEQPRVQSKAEPGKRLYTVAEYLRGDIEQAADFESDYEFVDGLVEERYVGELTHTDWQRALFKWFDAHESEWNIHVRTELRLQVTGTRFRIPDVMVWSRDNPREEIIRLPPLAVFEVLSPEDRMSRVLAKLEDYARMGIQTICVIHPARNLIYRYTAGHLDVVEEAVEQVRGSVCHLDWAQIRATMSA